MVNNYQNVKVIDVFNFWSFLLVGRLLPEPTIELSGFQYVKMVKMKMEPYKYTISQKRITSDVDLRKYRPSLGELTPDDFWSSKLALNSNYSESEFNENMFFKQSSIAILGGVYHIVLGIFEIVTISMLTQNNSEEEKNKLETIWTIAFCSQIGGDIIFNLLDLPYYKNKKEKLLNYIIPNTQN
jgi:hypothetical protein